MAEWEKPYHWKLIDGDWYSGCVHALMWWCNELGGNAYTSYSKSRFNIEQNKWLKEFMVQNPPTFKISAMCCKYAKKEVAKKYNKEHNIDLVILGIRKAEGGIRATAYKTCYSINDTGVDYHRPIFFIQMKQSESMKNISE